MHKEITAPVNYPEKLPCSYKELNNFWEEWTNQAVASTVLIAPEEYPWFEMELEWSNLVRLAPVLVEDELEGMNYMMEFYWDAVFGLTGFRWG